MLKKITLLILVIICLQSQSIYADTLQPKSEFIESQINLLEDYLRVKEDIKFIRYKDITTIIVFGSDNPMIVVNAFLEFNKILKTGQTNITIIFTGGVAADTLKLYQTDYVRRRMQQHGICSLDNICTKKFLYTADVKLLQQSYELGLKGIEGVFYNYITEAEVFADMFIHLLDTWGIPLARYISYSYEPKRKAGINIIIENESINCTDNVIKVGRILKKLNYYTEGDMLLVQKPIAQRRTFLAAQKYFRYIRIINSSYKKYLDIPEILIEINKIISLSNKKIILQERFAPKIKSAIEILRTV